MIESLLPLLGVALCAIVLVQMGLWTANSLGTLLHSRKHFQLSQELLRKQIELAASNQSSSKGEPLEEGRWHGFRQFRVDRLVKETELCTSVYLQPTDQKAICDFLPGQHLTLKFTLPGQPKPIVRCYSLSQGARKNEYRISVKAVQPPRDNPQVPAGLVSNFVNQQLKQGDLVDIKSPAGHFYLDTQSNKSVVLLAGGIGITPMAAMVDHILTHQPERQIILFYGSRFGADHAFKNYFAELQKQSPNLYVINAYSSPQPEDQLNVDYQVKGFVSIDLIKKLLPKKSYSFYMCGPPPFMDSIYNGLTEWGVPESQIHFEAFGPASIGKSRKQQVAADNAKVVGTPVKFSNSNIQTEFGPDSENLLDVAEANGVEVDSGCRSGNCGTCQVALLKGKVKYPEGEQVDCDPGHCLMCIAQPDGPVELEA
jgi:ferredoxin-NADP reductase